MLSVHGHGHNAIYKVVNCIVTLPVHSTLKRREEGQSFDIEFWRLSRLGDELDSPPSSRPCLVQHPFRVVTSVGFAPSS